MRDVRFKRHPAVGGSTFPWERGPIVDLLFAADPYFRHVPPLAAINELFSTGEMDNGMSGGASWKPFCIDQVEYEELVEELLTYPGRFITLEPSLEVCATYKDFERASLQRLRRRI